STVSLFWALCVVCIVNMARYFSSLRALLVVLRGCDPLLYQYVIGGLHYALSAHSLWLGAGALAGILLLIVAMLIPPRAHALP
ncbi:hypothetical protein MJN51_41550, partial [Salmonella enterica subsp. enterica serovar Kentucky]|nr:hypothetical protein [Salmonella enterica subsp. enterica serovar Kentucky]